MRKSCLCVLQLQHKDEILLEVFVGVLLGGDRRKVIVLS